MSDCGYLSYDDIMTLTKRNVNEIKAVLKESLAMNYGKYNNYALVKLFKL